jgi:hypothetical protein
MRPSGAGARATLCLCRVATQCPAGHDLTRALCVVPALASCTTRRRGESQVAGYGWVKQPAPSSIHVSMADSTVTKTLRSEGTPALYWRGDDAEEGRAGLLEGRGSWRQQWERCDGARSGQTEAPSSAAATHYAAACILHCRRLVPTGIQDPRHAVGFGPMQGEMGRSRAGVATRT